MKPLDNTLPVLVLTTDGSARFRLAMRSRGTTACFSVIDIVDSLATRDVLRALTSLDANWRADRSTKGTDAGRSVASSSDIFGSWLMCIVLTSNGTMRGAWLSIIRCNQSY